MLGWSALVTAVLSRTMESRGQVLWEVIPHTIQDILKKDGFSHNSVLLRRQLRDVEMEKQGSRGSQTWGILADVGSHTTNGTASPVGLLKPKTLGDQMIHGKDTRA